MSFKNAVLATPVETRTWNGMKALKDSLSNVTDLFFKIGASRGKNITAQFETAYHENRELALRVAQWARDARGGAGERELFRQILKFLEKNYKHELLDTRLLINVGNIGRWDDLLIFEDKEVKTFAYDIIYNELEAGNGLCAKWMNRKGPIAAELRNAFGWSPKYYRKRLVELTKVVETQMCAKQWDEINFSHVPSLAMARYSKAFGKNATDAFTEYKTKLQSGDMSVKVNAGAVYPYDVIKTVKHGDSALADEQWKALPDFIGDASVLPICDVSGSMCQPAGGRNSKSKVTCMDVSVSLGLYCASKNKGPFQDLFMTFAGTPTFHHLKGTLSQRIRQMDAAGHDWGSKTNLHAALDNVIKVATANDVAAEDMPKVLLVLSDMQFDLCVRYDDSAMQMIQRKYEVAGYAVPVIVWWNLNAADNVPVKFDRRGTALVSGFSPAILKSILAGDLDGMTPEAVMQTAVMSDRYAL